MKRQVGDVLDSLPKGSDMERVVLFLDRLTISGGSDLRLAMLDAYEALRRIARERTATPPSPDRGADDRPQYVVQYDSGTGFFHASSRGLGRFYTRELADAAVASHAARVSAPAEARALAHIKAADEMVERLGAAKAEAEREATELRAKLEAIEGLLADAETEAHAWEAEVDHRATETAEAEARAREAERERRVQEHRANTQEGAAKTWRRALERERTEHAEAVAAAREAGREEGRREGWEAAAQEVEADARDLHRTGATWEAAAGMQSAKVLRDVLAGRPPKAATWAAPSPKSTGPAECGECDDGWFSPTPNRADGWACPCPKGDKHRTKAAPIGGTPEPLRCPGCDSDDVDNLDTTRAMCMHCDHVWPPGEPPAAPDVDAVIARAIVHQPARRPWPPAAPTEPEPVCTGLTAFWCPVHGECTCSRDAEGECMFDAADCPLHNDTSQHAEDDEGSPAAAPLGAGPEVALQASEATAGHWRERAITAEARLRALGDPSCADASLPGPTENDANKPLRSAAREYARAWDDYANEPRKARAVGELEAAARAFAAPSAPQAEPSDATAAIRVLAQRAGLAEDTVPSEVVAHYLALAHWAPSAPQAETPRGANRAKLELALADAAHEFGLVAEDTDHENGPTAAYEAAWDKLETAALALTSAPQGGPGLPPWNVAMERDRSRALFDLLESIAGSATMARVKAIVKKRRPLRGGRWTSSQR